MTSDYRFKDMVELLNYHLRLHEGMELRDIYKLMHQSVFGPEHLEGATSQGAIAAEMKALPIEFEEPLLEPISTDAAACRINLRVARRLGIAPVQVSEAVRQSMERFSRRADELARLWDDARDTREALAKEFSTQEFEELGWAMCENGFPPLHHSPSYRDHNRPAYRVVVRSVFENLRRL